MNYLSFMTENTRPTIRYERITEDEPKAKLPVTAIAFAGVLGLMAIATFVALQVAFPSGSRPQGAGPVEIPVTASGPVESTPNAFANVSSEPQNGSLSVDVNWNQTISQLTPVAVEGIPVSRQSERWSLGPLEAFDRFHVERRADISFLMSKRQFDSATDEASRKAMFADIARTECLAITDAFADACALLSAKWSFVDGKDWADVRMELVFTQQQEFGVLPTSANGKRGVYTEKQMQVSSRGQAGLQSKTIDGAAKRRLLYADVAKKCGAMKRRDGNCAIQNVRIRTTPGATRGAVTEGLVALGRIAPAAG
ncbi:MAG: hypothetical protein AAF737_00115 [Pseudomonadota bacterium]